MWNINDCQLQGTKSLHGKYQSIINRIHMIIIYLTNTNDIALTHDTQKKHVTNQICSPSSSKTKERIPHRTNKYTIWGRLTNKVYHICHHKSSLHVVHSHTNTYKKSNVNRYIHTVTWDIYHYTQRSSSYYTETSTSLECNIISTTYKIETYIHYGYNKSEQHFPRQEALTQTASIWHPAFHYHIP
jgi:hypothetical protein